MCDGGLERGNHRILREDAANRIEPFLLGVGVCCLPRREEPRDGSRIDVGGGADAAHAAVTQALEEEGLAAREYVEACLGEVVQICLGIVPVAGGILGARDDARIGSEETLDQPHRDAHLRDGRDVIEVDAQTPVSHALDDLREILEEPVVGDALVVERREHEHAPAAEFHGMRSEPYRIGESAASRARHHAGRVHPPAHQTIEQLRLLFRRERVRLGVRTEYREAHVLAEQPPALPDEALGVRGEIGFEWGDDGRENAGDAIRHAHSVFSFDSRVTAAAHRTSWPEVRLGEAPYQSKTLSRLWKSSVHTPTRGLVSSVAAVQPGSCVRSPNAPGVRASTAQVEEVAPSPEGCRSCRRSRPPSWASSARLATTGSSERYRFERWRTSSPRTPSMSK